jgi:hypothetical protein
MKPFDIVVDPVGSKFAKSLQQALRDKVNNKVFRRSTPHPGGRVYFSVTQRALNKVEQFERFRHFGVIHPPFHTTPDTIERSPTRTIFARTLINATNGRGIVEFTTDISSFPNSPLYTEYIPKKAEYRFHVFHGKVIDVQQKKKSRTFDNDQRNSRVRNVANGYVYCRDGIDIPDGASSLAIDAVKALGYTYGAVDMIYNEKRAQCYVLEVNSRPGLMGTTLDKYADAIINQYNLQRK